MAHLLEHLVLSRIAAATRTPRRSSRSRRAPQRHAPGGSHELLRDVPGERREPRVGARSRSRPADRTRSCGRDILASQMTRRAQRVRGRREQSVRRPRSSAPSPRHFSGTTTGRARSAPRADIERVPIERLQAFYRKYYQPDNAVLVVAGQFDEARPCACWSQRNSGRCRRPAAPIAATYTEEPPQDGERTVVLRRVGDVQLAGRRTTSRCRRMRTRALLSIWARSFSPTPRPAGCTARSSRCKKAAGITRSTYLLR